VSERRTRHVGLPSDRVHSLPPKLSPPRPHLLVFPRPVFGNASLFTPWYVSSFHILKKTVEAATNLRRPAVPPDRLTFRWRRFLPPHGDFRGRRRLRCLVLLSDPPGFKRNVSPGTTFPCPLSENYFTLRRNPFPSNYFLCQRAARAISLCLPFPSLPTATFPSNDSPLIMLVSEYGLL